ncbi:MAG: 16S rRNA (guanine(966)-N(2))-methyltransferase RsmD [Minwuia sp.]|nr:16S rRNA (guanine(966)-N(2))-methyltransferase RsmD [Minwuia sp.]
MRIVAGRMRGLKLDGGNDTTIRPTADRTREGLFNLLAHNEMFRGPHGAAPQGCIVLDIFAGTGALGLEALSRGAAAVTFIEQADASLRILNRNIAKARAADDVRVIRADATRPRRAPRIHDLVLLDPPYGQGMAAPALLGFLDAGWFAPDALVVVETDGKDGFTWPDGFSALDTRSYGRARLDIGRRD